MNVKKIIFLLLLLISFQEILNTANFSVLKSDDLEKTEIKENENKFDKTYYQNLILKDCKFRNHTNFVNLNETIFELMVQECDKYKIPYCIFFSLVDKESGFRFVKNSQGTNAFGYMQLMPKTFSIYANKLKLEGGHNAENNVKVGAYHLSELYNFWSKKYKSEKEIWRWSIAQYNCGLGGLQVKDSNSVRYKIPESLIPTIENIMKNYK